MQKNLLRFSEQTSTIRSKVSKILTFESLFFCYHLVVMVSLKASNKAHLQSLVECVRP